MQTNIKALHRRAMGKNSPSPKAMWTHQFVNQSPFECLANDARNEFAVQFVGGQLSSILYTSRFFFLSLQLFSSQPKSLVFQNKPLPLNSEASLKLSAADFFLSPCSLQFLVSLMSLSHQSSWLRHLSRNGYSCAVRSAQKNDGVCLFGLFTQINVPIKAI